MKNAVLDTIKEMSHSTRNDAFMINSTVSLLGKKCTV